MMREVIFKVESMAFDNWMGCGGEGEGEYTWLGVIMN